MSDRLSPTSDNSLTRLIAILLPIFCYSIILERLLLLFKIDIPLLLPELLFPIGLIIIGIRTVRYPKDSIQLIKGFQFNWIDTLAILYGSIVLLSYITSQHPNAFKETFGAFYMASIYFLIRLSGIQLEHIRHAIPKALWITSISTLLALIPFYFWGDLTFSSIHEDYYILGDTIKSSGLTRSNLVIGDIISLGILLLIGFIPNWKKKIGLLFIILIALFLTKVKSVFLPFGLLLCFHELLTPIKNRLLNYLSRGVGIFCILFYLIVSHFFFFTDTKEVHHSEVSCKAHQFENIYIVPTPYYYTKVAAWHFFKESPLTGIGGDAFIDKVTFLQEPILDCPQSQTPHCTFTGSLAELGIFGFIIIGFTLLLIGNHIKKLNFLPSHHYFSLWIIFIFILLQMFTNDTMNFRHYWILLALFINFAYSSFSRIK